MPLEEFMIHGDDAVSPDEVKKARNVVLTRREFSDPEGTYEILAMLGLLPDQNLDN